MYHLDFAGLICAQYLYSFLGARLADTILVYINQSLTCIVKQKCSKTPISSIKNQWLTRFLFLRLVFKESHSGGTGWGCRTQIGTTPPQISPTFSNLVIFPYERLFFLGLLRVFKKNFQKNFQIYLLARILFN
jgi:hypothetical protein